MPQQASMNAFGVSLLASEGEEGTVRGSIQEGADGILIDDDGGLDVGLITPGGGKRIPKGHVGTTPFIRAVLLIMNAILGSGILGQAYAMRHSGWAVFVAGLVVMCGAAAYGAWLLLCCCETANVTSYEEVGQKSLGNLGHRLATAAILVQNAAAMTSYLVILGDVLPPLIQEAAGIERGTEDVPFYANRTFLMTAIAVVIILPLVSLRHISALGYSSALSIVIMVVFAAAAGSISTSVPCPLPRNRLPSGSPSSQQCAVEPASIGIDTFYVIPSIAFAFVCHTALLPVYTELKDRSKQRMMRVTGTAMFACSVLYLASATFGYMSFRGDISSDALKSMTSAFPDSWVISTVRALVCISVTVTVPLINYPARKAITLSLFPGKPFNCTRHVLLGAAIITVILIVAILVPNVRNVFGAAGATSSVSLMAILPGVFFNNLHRDSTDAAIRWHMRASMVFAAFGAIVGVVSFAGVIMSWVSAA